MNIRCLRKGILLAGGQGVRLFPMTCAMNKHLFPVYDMPMIYYPLCVLMLAGIRDILIISTREGLPLYQDFLGTGEKWGINLSYAIQPEPEGIAQAFIIGKSFIGSSPLALILGDNIFYRHNFSDLLKKCVNRINGATIFTYSVANPSAYGVIEYDSGKHPFRIVEKPERSSSNEAITGLYFYDSSVVEVTRGLPRSARGEYEISDINQYYLEQGSLQVIRLGQEAAWFDAGTPDSLLEAAQFVKKIQSAQGVKIACPEEVALRCGYISTDLLEKEANKMKNGSYRDYVKNIILSDKVEFA